MTSPRTECVHHDCVVTHVGEDCPLCLARGDASREKRGILHGFLREGIVDVHLNPDIPGVVLPPHLMEFEQVVLNLGHQMAVPIPDLNLDEDGITATLSFDRSPFTVKLPWESVFGISIGEKGAVWVASMPVEFREKVRARQAVVTRKEPEIMGVEEVHMNQQGRPVGRFSVIDGGSKKEG